jgi:hypothetical protein
MAKKGVYTEGSPFVKKAIFILKKTKIKDNFKK